MQNAKHRYLPNGLRKHRRARGLTQREVMRALGLESPSVISRWEHGVCLPKSWNLFKLASLYRTMVDALYIDLIRLLREEVRQAEDKMRQAKTQGLPRHKPRPKK
jgi:transcriptional regulator with XRE-family HTH domain